MDNGNDILVRIKEEAQRGDFLDVARKLHISRSLVYKVVNGSRRNTQVVQELVKLLDIRKAVTQEFQHA
jgi:predicted transcriptional regulator